MYTRRKSRSLDDRSYTEENVTPRDARRTSVSAPHHRRQSSIPKPSAEAPLFRNDTVDRFYSKIPYPTTGGNLFYDVLTGNECWRYGKPREATPRGGLSNLSTLRPTSRQDKPECGGRESREACISPMSIGSPTSDLRSVERRLLSSMDAQECRTMSFSQADSRRCRYLKPRSDSVSSQTSTVLEYGSESTGFAENWGPSSYTHSITHSETSSEFLTGVPKSRPEAKLVALSPSFLRDCAVPRDERSVRSRSDLNRISSASDVHAPRSCRDMRTPHTTSTPSSYRTTGRLRRRPQKPVSEDSDDEDDNWTEDGSALHISSTKGKRRLLSRAASFLFSRKAADPDELTLEDLERCAAASQLSISSRATSLDPYEWVQHHAPDFYALDKKHPTKDTPKRRNRFSRLLQATVSLSVRALLVFSGAALAHVIMDRHEKGPADPTHEREVSEFDIDADTLSYSSCALVSSGPIAYSYPISLLESMSDIDAQ